MVLERPRKVAYIYPYAYHYRQDFNDLLRRNLADRNIIFDVIYCSDPRLKDPRGDLRAPAWAIDVKCTLIRIGKWQLRYQHCFLASLDYDLVILQQENGLLLNYPLQLLSMVFGKNVAFFGHGRNLQARTPKSVEERFKRFWATRVDWWFAYTSKCAAAVIDLGFPRERVTIFNNSIDVRSIESSLTRIRDIDREGVRNSLVSGSRNVGVYVGGLYTEKRISFLVSAAIEVRRHVHDFHLLIIGGGPDADLATKAALEHDWIHYAGPKFGDEKSLLVSLGKVFLMPGLVGLAILDSFAYGTPLVTTDLPYHSPEIDYLENGRNGVIVKAHDDVEAYAQAVRQVIIDDEYRERLKSGGTEALRIYSLHSMVQRFEAGVIQALQCSAAPVSPPA